MESIIALVLAGGEEDELSQSQAVKHKANIIVNGKPLFEPVLKALKESKEIAKTIYVGSLDDSYHKFVDKVIEAGDSFYKSLSLGIKATTNYNPSKILVITADLPFIKASTISEFIRRSSNAELVYPIIKKETSLEQFPNQKRTYAKFIEGSFTGGNAILFKPKISNKLLVFADRAYKARKSPLKLAFLLGIDIFISLMLGRSSISKLEKRVSKLLDADVKTYICQDASLGADIDKLEHLQNIS